MAITIQLLVVILAVGVGIQLIYLLFIFSRTAFYRQPTPDKQPLGGVSVIVAAWNELENLQTLLPILDSQDFPNFEVIVVNDRSNDGTFEYLLSESKQFKHVRYIHIDKNPEHITAKKYAITLGIKSANHDVILLTDADCRPVSDQWIKGMFGQLSSDKDIVLGVSPYYKLDGFLNSLIRFETFYTALQYISFALAGLPYMGVGRNLMYRKQLFLSNKGFHNHNHIIGGDDDLFMNEVANADNVALCLDLDTFVYSMPKNTYDEWYAQKRRHLSVGKYYKFRNKFILGLLGISHIITWSIFIPALTMAIIQYDWYQTAWIGGLFGLRWLLQWIVFGMANAKLGKMIHWIYIPFYDFCWFLYYTIMGGINTFSKKKLVTWK
jgi:glycosyltransferase involved in cell wall biosynthesis